MIASARSTGLVFATGLCGLLLSSSPAPLGAWHLAAPVRHGDTDAAAARGLRWLSQQMQGKAWFKPAGAMANTTGKRQATTAIASWAALAAEGGLAAEDGAADVDPEVAKAWQASLAKVAGGGGFATAAFANWLDGMSGLYFCELSLKEGQPGRALRRIVSGFEGRQNPEGAWGHGMMGGGFYPSTLVAASNWALLVLGLAARQGLEVEPDVIDEALALYRKVQGKNGSLPYGGLPYRKGYEAGRTSGTVVALLALGSHQDPMFRRAAQYVRRNLVAVPNGHASPAMHVFMGALAAYALGNEDWQRYRSTVLARVLASQKADGSFEDIQGISPDSLRLMGDDLTNRAYITALYTAALAVPHSRVAKEIRLQAPLPAIPRTHDLAELGDPLWKVAAPEGASLVHARDRVLILDRSGRVHVFDAATGEAKEGFRIGSETSPKIADGRFFTHGDDVFVWAMPDVKRQIPGSMKEMLEAARKRRKNPGPRPQLACWSVGGQGTRWVQDLPGPLTRVCTSSEGVHLLLMGGKVRSIDRDGNNLHEPFRGPALKANGAITRLDNGHIVVSGESRLAAFDREGTELWKVRGRAQRGVTPAAIGALATGEGLVYAGLSSGEVWCLSAEDGKKRWRVQTGAAVAQLELCGTGAQQTLIVLTYDGSIHGVRKGKLLWTTDVTEGTEAPHPPRIILGNGVIWAGSTEAGRLVKLDQISGRIQRRLVLPKDAHWDVGGGRIYIAGKQGLGCYR